MRKTKLFKISIIVIFFLIFIFIIINRYQSVGEEVRIVEVKDSSIIVEDLSKNKVEIRTPQIVIKLIENNKQYFIEYKYGVFRKTPKLISITPDY